jgi:hypothetical protein
VLTSFDSNSTTMHWALRAVEKRTSARVRVIGSIVAIREVEGHVPKVA